MMLCGEDAGALALLTLMKVINQLATFNYNLFSGSSYEATNGTCRYKETAAAAATADLTRQILFQFSYIWAAVGGLISSACRNRTAVLTVGGWLMTFACAVVALVRVLGLTCHRTAYTLTWLLYPVFMSLLLAPLLAAFADFGALGTRPGSRRTLSLVLYYVSASSTIWFNMIPVDSGRHGGSYEFVALCATVFGIAFVVAARLLKIQLQHQQQSQLEQAQELLAQISSERFELPTARRTLRYCLILSGMTMYIVQQTDGHIASYQAEALYYMNTSSLSPIDESIVWVFRSRLTVLRIVNVVGMLAASAVLIGLSLFSWNRPPPSFRRRLLTGVAISAGASIWSLACDLGLHGIATVQPTIAAVAFSVPAFAEGAAEVLTMVAAYEFVDQMAPQSHKDLVMGIALSLWNMASLLRIGIYSYVIPLLVTGHSDSSIRRHFAYCTGHAAAFLLCAASWLYIRFISLPLAFTILQTPPAEEPERMSHQSPAGEASRQTTGKDSGLADEQCPLLATYSTTVN